ncbi:unnamed protein product [Boreogadus saida]
MQSGKSFHNRSLDLEVQVSTPSLSVYDSQQAEEEEDFTPHVTTAGSGLLSLIASTSLALCTGPYIAPRVPAPPSKTIE